MIILDNPAAAPERAWARIPLSFLLAHPAHLIALGFGSGLARVAPGTFGTLFGWLVFVWVAPAVTDKNWGVILLFGFLIGVWACEKTGRALGAPDHGAMVWDEIIAIWLVLLFTPVTWPWRIAAFVLFRFFDIVKPPPISFVDRRWKGGLGVMADDLVAAFFAILVIALWRRFVDGAGTA